MIQTQSRETSLQQQTDRKIPQNNTLRRLAVEAGKFLGRNAGEPLPIDQLIKQGRANGYDESEIRGRLEVEDLAGVDEIELPRQGDLLGDLWRPDKSLTQAPNPIDKNLQKFRDWCRQKREMRREEYDDGVYQHPVEHSYSYKKEVQKFARFKSVERYFVQEYPRFTTVLLTYDRPRSEGESVAEHAAKFYPEYPISRKRRRCIKAMGYWEEFAGVSLLAPKNVAPKANAKSTHAHDMLLIPTFVSSECFDPLREEGVDVSIRYHRSDKVEAPPSINRLDLEQERGATTALAQEVGANLPILTAIQALREETETDDSVNWERRKATLDATDCPSYVERWCAHLSCGKDGNPSSKGVRRWRPLGRFTELADRGKDGESSESEGRFTFTESDESDEINFTFTD